MIEAIEVVASDGAILAARRAGNAGPAVVFVHGVGSTAAIWDAQLSAFGNRYRCLAVELRGNGAIQPDPDPVTITRGAFAADVLALASACGVNRFTLVGCSLGGVVGFELWIRAPERLQAMVLADSFAYYPNGNVNVETIAAAVRAAGDMRAFGRQRADKLGLAPHRLQETIDQMACKSVPCYLAASRATWTGDYRDLLSLIDLPVAVVCGEYDTVTPPALSREIAGGIAGASFDLVMDAGHVSNADNPQGFNALLDRFLSGSITAASQTPDTRR